MEEDETPNVSLVSCMCFVKKGVAKEIPEKVEINEQELASIIQQTAGDLKLSADDDEEESESGSDTEGAGTSADNPTKPSDPDDEFDFEKYDEDNNDANPIGIGSVATLTNPGDLGDHVRIRTEGPDSDEEDDIIKPTDNLLLVGHVESDASILEVYIYNKEENSFYVHHDMILPWFPLCIEWLNHDPSEPQPGNLCAIGGMDPVIQVWDLDIENSLEPIFKLGKKPNKKKGIKRVGHKDAVLDLAWNKNFSHVIASGSADNTVLLWDIDKGEPHTRLTYFEDKIQCLSWHPHEAQTLLSGSGDKSARVSDCRADDAVRAWKTAGEVERAIWDAQQPFCFAVSTNDGKVYYYDVRQIDPLWMIQAHEKEVTGLLLNEQVPGFLVTVGGEGTLKTWDISTNPPTQVSLKSLRVGQILCAASCPEHPDVVAVGGDNKECFIQVLDLYDTPEVSTRFASRQTFQLAAENSMES